MARSVSFPGSRALVDQAPQFAPATQLPRGCESEVELEELQLVIPPRIRNTLPDALLDEPLHLFGRRRVAELETEFDRVAVPGAHDGHLPDARDLGQILQQLLEEPVASIAHSAIDHLVRAPPDLREAAG